MYIDSPVGSNLVVTRTFDKLMGLLQKNELDKKRAFKINTLASDKKAEIYVFVSIVNLN